MPSTLSSIYLPASAPKRPLATPLSTKVTSAIADLRESWHRLHDLDRALAVRNIVQLGVSRRRLANELGFSEGLIRHLLKALEASSADQELARRHAISTNELVRRASGHGAGPVIDTTVPSAGFPKIRSTTMPGVWPAIPDVPLLKPSRRHNWLRTRQPPARKSIIGGWWNT